MDSINNIVEYNHQEENDEKKKKEVAELNNSADEGGQG